MMRATSILYMVLGIAFMAVVYLFNLFHFMTWTLVYWITMGFLAFIALFYRVSRWPFIWGVALAFVVLVLLVRFNYIPKSISNLPF